MESALRDKLNAATARARQLLEEEFRQQLEADYDVFPDGRIGSQVPKHLDARGRLTRAKVLAALHHKRAAGSANDESVTLLLRETAFTALNRVCALKLAEARGLVQECVSRGTESAGFSEFQLLAPGLNALGDRAYRLFLECLCDELHLELGALFDRREAGALLWPRWPALQALLAIVNNPELAAAWQEDETIGWIYQYFNSTDERREMRKASSAPRNSRELAVRNQFFTPRYVVRFLIDNTLGRQWWLATGGATALKDRCSLLMIAPDDQAPAAEHWRDPRTIRLLDPACGSMHFGLYAFDVFQVIYLEAWEHESSGGTLAGPDGQAAPALRGSYPNRAAFERDIPRLILAHNIHGVDIDPRAVQVSRLALWLRAQRAWHQAQVPVTERPAIEAIQVIAAIAPPSDADTRIATAHQLPEQDQGLLVAVLKLMSGLDEMGVLLRLERDLRATIRKALHQEGTIFDNMEGDSWREAEDRLISVLRATAEEGSFQGRLVAENAMHGIRLLDLIREPFDVVVMNPPFGAAGKRSKDQLAKAYPRSKHDLLAMFVERGIELLRPGGRLGAITSRTGFFLSSYKTWREEVVLGTARPEVMADLGYGVMDDAMVEAAAYVLERVPQQQEVAA